MCTGGKLRDAARAGHGRSVRGGERGRAVHQVPDGPGAAARLPGDTSFAGGSSEDTAGDGAPGATAALW